MIKKESGITIMVLAITVVIILIIAGITISKGSEVIKEAQLENLKTDMLLIQAKGKLIAEEIQYKTVYEKDKDKKESIKKEILTGNGTKVADITDNTIKQTITSLGIEGIDQYYYLDKTVLDSMGLGKVKIEDGAYYVVNYDIDNPEVVYTGGYKAEDGNIYYTLTQINNL